METFGAFGTLVADCQAAGSLPAMDTKALTAILYSSHSRSDRFGIGGTCTGGERPGNIETISDLLLNLISHNSGLSPANSKGP
jgi:hypothetical protein